MSASDPRYARHLSIPEVGESGQARLAAASVLLIGAGGLGSPSALYLAAAGVGRLGIVDPDRVELSNLQRQILHGTPDIGRLKLDSARDRLGSVNPEIEVVPHPVRFTAENAMGIAADYDVIVDGTDNFPTRYLSNDIAVWQKKPNVYGSVHRFEGQCSVFAPHLGGPCYRCMFPVPPAPGAVPSCAEAGVLGVLPGLVGTLQAIEAIKLILGKGEPLTGRLLHLDSLAMKFREFTLRRDPDCPVCGSNPTITEPIDYNGFCGLPDEEAIPRISVAEFAGARGARVRAGCPRAPGARRRRHPRQPPHSPRGDRESTRGNPAGPGSDRPLQVGNAQRPGDRRAAGGGIRGG